jgi:hypothetical protein
MALYVVGGRLIRARNGDHACEIAEQPEADVLRVKEDGEYGFVTVPGSGPQPLEAEPDEPDEIEITNLNDKGARRFKNKKTGEERAEKKT